MGLRSGALQVVRKQSSATACFLYVFGGEHPTLEDITDDGKGIVTSSLGDKSEVRVVLVQNIDE